MLRCTLENRNAQTKQLQAAVSNVEKHLGELCQVFAAYVRKTARLRDKVERLEAKVVEPLKAYGTIVKTKRDDPKATFTARNREAKQLTQVEGTGQRNLSHLIDMLLAAMDATRTSHHLEETTDNFERQKIKAIKTIFSKFITIKMLFHSKALEVYTAAYQNIQKIDEHEDLDLEVVLNSLYAPDYSSRLDMVRANSKSPHQRSLSAKCVSGTGQDQQADDGEDEESDVTEEDSFLK
uniref:CBY1 interacting BAR domain containing 1 n=1 Tax=Gorilla gorilla gorilla TaxID=9595 RepID=A0A2I2YYZ7_GORGO